jgi:hypothetical protein
MSALLSSKLLRRRGKRSLLALASCALAVACLAPTAQAQIAVERFGIWNSTGDHFPTTTTAYSPGQISRQAGGHGNLTTAFKFGFDLGGDFRDIAVDLPPGLVGNPNITPKCEVVELTSGPGQSPECGLSTQIGVAKIEGEVAQASGGLAIYNMIPPPTLPALFAFVFSGVPIFVEPHVRPTDYGLRTGSNDSLAVYPIHLATLKFWGVPADHAHDAERGHYGGTNGDEPSSSPLSARPFLSNPTSCGATPSLFSVDVNSWLDPTFSHAEVSADPEGVPFLWENCDRLHFEPRLDVTPGARGTAQPSGLDVTVVVPQDQDPDGLSTPHVRKTVVTLPKGFSISAAAASGIGGCSEAQIGFGTNERPTCPGSSSLGTIKLKTPLLEEELDGEIFLAKQNENPFGSLIAFYLAIKGPGFYIKLPGLTETDKQTGQITSSFDNTPQLPFERMRLSFRGGAKAPLVAPDRCGTYFTQIDMTSWASPIPVHTESPTTINENCDTGGFDPKLHAGSTNPVAGAKTPFNVQITRNDGEQNIANVDATLPSGLVARLAGVPLCQGAAAATGSCSAASEIGSITVGGGNGPQPLYIPEPGKAPTHVYFGGPYKGAAYSLVFAIPAQAGPFDLGTVVVRAALYIDPNTAQVTIKSDPVPQILEGVPIPIRDMRIEITKPSFTLNPTNCTPSKFVSTITSAQGKVAKPTSRFQVSDCASLAFKPKLSIHLKGGTNRSQYPALRATLKQKAGQANIAKVATTLPHSEFLANEHIQTICTRVQYAASKCPEKAVYGHATAWSPLLDKPIDGPVYLRSSDHELPDLVADLGGAIDIDLVGRIDSVDGGIRTTFEAVPDAPVSKFVLAMQGGDKGLLVNSRNLCKSTSRAKILVDGQNGKTANQNPVVTNGCKKKKSRKAKKSGRR